MKKLVIAVLILCFCMTGCAEKSSAASAKDITKSGDMAIAVEGIIGKNTAKPESPVVYTNKQYGFEFTLPSDWKGYTIVIDKWDGMPTGDSTRKESGPLINIRNPLWTKENPYQDIPIMVFTIDQWNALQDDEFHIGAAPIGPNELGRNSKYVFAIPARYNFAFPSGYQDVEKILEGTPLKPIEGSDTVNQ